MKFSAGFENPYFRTLRIDCSLLLISMRSYNQLEGSKTEMRIIFHLGAYKTATSTLQNTLYENRDILLEQGVLYPQTGLKTGDLLGRRHTPIIYQYMDGKAASCPPELLDEINGSNAHTTILSSEAWSKPDHLTQLTRLVSVLEENGFDDCVGVLSLRNLSNYQVSHYREFTLNQNNSLPFRKYLRRRLGMFDYLFLTRAFQSIFTSGFHVLPFDNSPDIVFDLFKAMGIGPLYDQMKPVERANVKSAGPMEVEAVRCARVRKKSAADGLAALSAVLSDDVSLRETVWTERYKGDTPSFTSAYLKNLRNVTNLSEGEVEALFVQPALDGRRVQDISRAIMDKLKEM